MTGSVDSNTLPALPLPDGVILPGMVVTIAAESQDAQAAASASTDTGGELLLVPKVGDRFATVGAVAHVAETPVVVDEPEVGMPDEVRDAMTIHLVDDVRQVLTLALAPAA